MRLILKQFTKILLIGETFYSADIILVSNGGSLKILPDCFIVSVLQTLHLKQRTVFTNMDCIISSRGL